MIKVYIPIRTVSESNKAGEHWTKKHKRHKLQKQAVLLSLKPKIANKTNSYHQTCEQGLLPCIITLTRVAPRKLDSHDNLASSMKWILDAVCELLIPCKAVGHADSDERIQIKYDQKKGECREYGIIIEILPIKLTHLLPDSLNWNNSTTY